MEGFQREFEDNVEHAVKQLNIQDYTITYAGNTKFGQGFMGDIIFATVHDNSNKKSIDIVIKTSMPSKILREKTPMTKMYLREILFYSELCEEFKKLQAERNVKNPFNNYIPKYYGSSTSENNEVLVLENLNPKGFTMYPKKEPFTLAQTKLILERFGKFHALSFALRDQKPEVYGKLAKKCSSNLYAEFAYNCGFINLLKNNFIQSISLLEGVVNESTLEKYKTLEKKFDSIIKSWHLEDPEYSVVCHGDCWGNNYMFKFEVDEDTGKEKVVDALILDWQHARISPPVIDLANFLCTTSSSDQFDQMDKLLDLYYTSFATHLSDLGSDPQKLFPKSKFLEQWKKYSVYGVCLAPAMIKFCLADIPEDETELSQVLDTTDELAKLLIDLELTDVKPFVERLRQLVNYFFKD